MSGGSIHRSFSEEVKISNDWFSFKRVPNPRKKVQTKQMPFRKEEAQFYYLMTMDKSRKSPQNHNYKALVFW